MIENQFIEELLSKIRNDSAELNLHDLEIHVGSGSQIAMNMASTIEIGNAGIYLKVYQRQGNALPPEIDDLFQSREGTPVRLAQTDIIWAKAITDDGLELQLDGIVPLPSERTTNTFTSTLRLRFKRINVLPTGFDDQTYQQINQMRRHANDEDVSGIESSEEERGLRGEHVLFGILPRVKLKIANRGVDTVTTHPFRGELSHGVLNCFTGELLGGEFCLEAKDEDLWVYYRKCIREGDPVPGKVFDGILDAIAFTHGCHPHLFYRQERIEGRLVERWCAPRGELNRNPLAPMSSGRLHRLEDGRHLFNCAVEFFSSDSEDAQACSRALWLMREACRENMAHEVSILSLCSILEGLLAPYSGQTWGDGSPKLGTAEGWQAAIVAIGLDWNNCFADVWRSSHDFRNNMAHGFRITPNTGNADDILNAYSRISAGIYITIAQKMNFQGTMEKSLIEGRDTVSLS
ncbi:hypothetical protein [Cerasicoccus fimbriatus]|uniref:hypothetical protein n=1 Tax=Cerasicoccus fimbriatus TaxID=3014554 RepID=UPI0022B46212|nr:hypothetical protein [Cerasicoccus sp. TK19100]